MEKKKFLIIATVASVLLFSCNEEFEDQTLTKDIEKIETIYLEGASKYEGQMGKKIETRASDSYITNLQEELTREINRMMGRRSNGRTAAAGDYDIGFVSSENGYCGGEKVSFFMDCEDSSPTTRLVSGNSSTQPWEVDPNKNFRMYFCRFDGTIYDSRRYYQPHAVLKLGALNLPNSTSLVRYFDNQDRNNKNSHSGNIYPNVRNTNTTLHFHVFDAYPFGPPFYPGDGVIAAANTSTGGTYVYNNYQYYIDDEDDSNANYYLVNGVKRSTSPYTFISGDNNTNMYLVMYYGYSE